MGYLKGLRDRLKQAASPILFLGISLCLVIGLLGCQLKQAPLEFAPDGDVIKREMQRELSQHYGELSNVIEATPPTVQPKNIRVKAINSFFLNRLPVYHTQGLYDVSLKFSNQEKISTNNSFDLYLQRQTEGKTWRSLEETENGWRSYQVPDK